MSRKRQPWEDQGQGHPGRKVSWQRWCSRNEVGVMRTERNHRKGLGQLASPWLQRERKSQLVEARPQ